MASSAAGNFVAGFSAQNTLLSTKQSPSVGRKLRKVRRARMRRRGRLARPRSPDGTAREPGPAVFICGVGWPSETLGRRRSELISLETWAGRVSECGEGKMPALFCVRK